MTTKTQIKTLNIYQRMNAVMHDVKALNKEGHNSHQKYKFVTHDAVAKALHVPLMTHGIQMIPTVKEMKQDGNRTVVTMDIRFVNIDNPEDSVSVEYTGYGIDPQDKGPGKAISYAVKYALLKTFCLETGDDIEKDSIEYKKEKSPQEEAQKIESMFDEALPDDIDMIDLEEFVKYCVKQYKKDSSMVKKSAIKRMDKFLESYGKWQQERWVE